LSCGVDGSFCHHLPAFSRHYLHRSWFKPIAPHNVVLVIVGMGKKLSGMEKYLSALQNGQLALVKVLLVVHGNCLFL